MIAARIPWRSPWPRLLPLLLPLPLPLLHLSLLRWEAGGKGVEKVVVAAAAAAAAGLASHHRQPAGQGAAGRSAVAAPSAVVCTQACPMLPLQ